MTVLHGRSTMLSMIPATLEELQGLPSAEDDLFSCVDDAPTALPVKFYTRSHQLPILLAIGENDARGIRLREHLQERYPRQR